MKTVKLDKEAFEQLFIKNNITQSGLSVLMGYNRSWADKVKKRGRIAINDAYRIEKVYNTKIVLDDSDFPGGCKRMANIMQLMLRSLKRCLMNLVLRKCSLAK